MKLTFLGTSSMLPTKDRNTTAILLSHKAENILIESFSETNLDEISIKLTDFGTANYNVKMFKHIGTPYYVAPEVLTGKYNEKCDMWSCGVLLYYLLV